VCAVAQSCNCEGCVWRLLYGAVKVRDTPRLIRAPTQQRANYRLAQVMQTNRKAAKQPQQATAYIQPPQQPHKHAQQDKPAPPSMTQCIITTFSAYDGGNTNFVNNYTCLILLPIPTKSKRTAHTHKRPRRKRAGQNTHA